MKPLDEFLVGWKIKIPAIFILALAVRLLYLGLFVQSQDLLIEDQGMYVKMAGLIGDGLWKEIIPDRVLGYPIFLSLIQKTFGNLYPATLMVQGMVDSATCVLIGLLAQTILGQGFLGAGLLSALNLNMIILSGMILTDTLALFFFTASLLGMAFYFRRGNAGWATLCLGSLAAATAVRPTTYYLYPVIVLALAGAALVIRKIPGQSVGIALAGIFFWALFLGPQHGRNWIQHNYAGYVSQGGVHLVGWVVPGVYQYGGLGSYEEGERFAQATLKKLLSKDGIQELPSKESLKERYLVAAGGECLQEMGWGRITRAWITGSVVNLLAPSIAFAPRFRELKSASFYYTPGKNLAEKLTNYIRSGASTFYLAGLAVGTICSAALLGLAGLGYYRVLRQSHSPEMHGLCVLMLLVFGYFLLITGPVVGTKYRLPIEPILIALGTAGILTRKKSNQGGL